MTEQDNTPQEALSEPVMDAGNSGGREPQTATDGLVGDGKTNQVSTGERDPGLHPNSRPGSGQRMKAWWFKPGVSGNPTGRPKGSVNLTNQIKRELRENPQDAKAVCRGIIDQAIAGDMRASQILLDRVDGLLVKKVEISDTSHMKRLGFKDPLETVPLDEADEPRTLDMSAGDGSDECEQEPDGDGSVVEGSE